MNVSTDNSRPVRRAAELVAGFLTWKVADNAFDYLLYPFVVWKLGPWRGGMLMAFLSLLFCLVLLRLYDRLQRDWLGIEFAKAQRLYTGPKWWRKAIAWLLARGDGTAFVVLSLRYDPFITTAYLRHGAYNGMNARDWRIFFGSWLVANAAWIAVCYGGVSFLKFLN